MKVAVRPASSLDKERADILDLTDAIGRRLRDQASIASLFETLLDSLAGNEHSQDQIYRMADGLQVVARMMKDELEKVERDANALSDKALRGLGA